MPTERFLRLAEEKKLVICNAAIKEFTRVPYEKASINRMICDAGISRGSFYTYFADKRDILAYIFSNINEKMGMQWKRSLQNNQGKFWLMANEVLEYTLSYFKNQNLMLLFKNTMPFQSHMEAVEKQFQVKSVVDGEGLQELYDATDKVDLGIDNIEDYKILLGMFKTELIIAIIRFFQNPENVEDIKHIFNKKMRILRYGVSKHNIV